MRKIILVVTMVSLITAAAFADHPAKTGVGIVATGSYGSSAFGGRVGLALKLKDVPLFWGLQLALSQSNLSFGVTGDQYFYDTALVREGAFKLDWFLGLGGYANISLSPSASLGARLPIGLSWHITPQFELWIDIAPSLGVSVAPTFNFPDWSIPGEVGFRAWL